MFASCFFFQMKMQTRPWCCKLPSAWYERGLESSAPLSRWRNMLLLKCSHVKHARVHDLPLCCNKELKTLSLGTESCVWDSDFDHVHAGALWLTCVSVSQDACCDITEGPRLSLLTLPIVTACNVAEQDMSSITPRWPCNLCHSWPVFRFLTHGLAPSEESMYGKLPQ